MGRSRAATLKLTNLDKVLFPAATATEPVTKRDLIRYHAAIAPVMLPYLADRPVNLHRFPDGVDQPGFWHKAVPEPRARLDARAGTTTTPTRARPSGTSSLDSPPALAWLANYGAVELHPWTSTRRRRRTEPTWALIDIDPGPRPRATTCCVLARLYRTALDHLGVRGGPKVTGQRGIQIWVPVADGLHVRRHPGVGRDASRGPSGRPCPSSSAGSGRSRTAAAWPGSTTRRTPSTRRSSRRSAPARRPGAPVSVPITWDELDDPDLRPDRWTIRTVLDRLEADGDPLRPLIGLQQKLPDLA